MRRLVGMDGRVGVNALGDRLDRLGLALEDEGKRAALALAHDDDDLALAGLVDRKASIAAVLLMIGRLAIASERGAIDFDRARGFHVVDFGGKRLADFVGENESRLVLHVEIAG